VFLDCLKKLPIRHRESLVSNLINFMPNCEIDAGEGCLEESENWLRRQSLRPAKKIGSALAIKAIIEFTVVQHITRISQCEEQAEKIDFLIQECSSEPDKENKTSWLQSHRESLEFNAAQAVRMKETWVDICGFHFANEALKDGLLNREINY
jgi:hypothetical protein